MANPANPAQFPIAQRDAFLIPSGPNLTEDQFHLFVVLTDPGKSNEVLMVNATTCYPNIPDDPSCYLEAGDHNFIQHRSYVLYEKSRKLSITKLRQLIAAKTIIFRPPPVNHAVFTRIGAAVPGSRMSPDHIDFFNRYR
ncbi:hypothetical protein [Undibacterium griseum]|uniref:Uncharacterized protein n=1 Tax=Undibacterium griseum TaxID=2762295 RepID=A0ABR6YP45_9BURK|nr:hypothetical protein [Undibacterium griseum]MBC3885650.1 hypothetical protein [Undibacterium griseum]